MLGGGGGDCPAVDREEAVSLGSHEQVILTVIFTVISKVILTVTVMLTTILTVTLILTVTHS